MPRSRPTASSKSEWVDVLFLNQLAILKGIQNEKDTWFQFVRF